VVAGALSFQNTKLKTGSTRMITRKIRLERSAIREFKKGKRRGRSKQGLGITKNKPTQTAPNAEGSGLTRHPSSLE